MKLTEILTISPNNRLSPIKSDAKGVDFLVPIAICSLFFSNPLLNNTLATFCPLTNI